MNYSKDFIEHALRGYYKTGAFHIFLKGDFSSVLQNMSQKDLGTFVHEYIHYLQNVATPWGIFSGAARNAEIAEALQQAMETDTIHIPFQFHKSADLEQHLLWVNLMEGMRDFERYPEECIESIDGYGLAQFDAKGRKGQMLVLAVTMKDYKTEKIFVGVHIIKEWMACLYQSLIDNEVQHPDLPYNILQVLCNQHFPNIAGDVKKLICVCYTSLFSLQPSQMFIEMLRDANANPEKSGFDIFDDFVKKRTCYNAR